jgi:hypothetical protein
MKKFALALMLLMLCLQQSGNAAFANDWFNHWDHNHDGQWNRNEYMAAQSYWARSHPGYPAAGWGPAFVTYDHNHDHYWDRHEAWRYHHW